MVVICYNYNMMNIEVKILLLSVVAFFAASCDISKQYVIGTDRSYVITRECGSITITGATIFHEHLFAEINGEFSVTPSALRLEVSPSYVSISNLVFFFNDKEINDISSTLHINGHEKVSVRFDYSSEVAFDKKNVSISLSPSEFLMCANKPVITDTIKIQLK